TNREVQKNFLAIIHITKKGCNLVICLCQILIKCKSIEVICQQDTLIHQINQRFSSFNSTITQCNPLKHLKYKRQMEEDHSLRCKCINNLGLVPFSNMVHMTSLFQILIITVKQLSP